MRRIWKTGYSSLPFLSGVLVFAWMFCTAGAAPGQINSRPPVGFPPGPALTIKNVTDLVTAVKRKTMTEERVIMGLKARGVAFPPTAESLSRLRAAGASEVVLNEVREQGKIRFPPPALPPPGPPPATPRPRLTMLVQCSPAECQVRVNDLPFRNTRNGEVLFEGLNRGRVIVDAAKDGFKPRTEVVNLPDSGTNFYAMRLEPTEETQRLWGRHLWESLARTLPSKTGPRTLTGQVQFSNSSAATWDFIAHFENDGAATVELQSSSGQAAVTCQSGRCVPASKDRKRRFKDAWNGKPLKTEAVERLLPQVELMVSCEFEAFSSSLAENSAEATAPAAPATSPKPQTFRIPAASGIYTLQLSGDMKLIGFAYDLSIGVGTGIRVRYDAYQKFGDLNYPIKTEVKFGGEDTHSFSFQVGTVAEDVPAKPKRGNRAG